MEQHDESHDTALAQALAEEETTFVTASNIEHARKLTQRPAFLYQEIVFGQGEQNVARAWPQQASTNEAQEPAEDPAQEASSLGHCLICDRAEHLSKIQDGGHLCL
jgi:hypothetical protein